MVLKLEDDNTGDEQDQSTDQASARLNCNVRDEERAPPSEPSARAADDTNNQRESDRGDTGASTSPRQTLAPDTAARVENLQQGLLQFLPRTDLRLEGTTQQELLAAVADEMKGLVRDSSGKIIRQLDTPIYGKATQQALTAYVGYLEHEAIPGTYARIANANSPLPSGGPIPLPPIGEGAAAIGPSLFISRAAAGTLECKLGIDAKEIPQWDQLDKVASAQDWLERADNSLQQGDLQRLQEIVRHRIEAGGFPKEWKVDTPESCAAAMLVMNMAKETGRMIEAVDFLSKTVSPESQPEWLRKLNEDALPKGVHIQREGDTPDGNIKAIKFDFPKDLALLTPEFRTQLRELDRWCRDNKRELDSMMAEHNKSVADPRNALGWIDMEVPKGWVKLTDKPDGNVEHQLTTSDQAPADGGWHKFNLLELRCGATEIRDQSGELKKVKVWGTMSYDDVPNWSYQNLYKPVADGTKTMNAEQGERDPNDWLVIRTNESETKFIKAKDLQDFADDQRFWHIAGKTVVGVMDASMLLGAGELAVGARAIRTARSASATMEMIESAAKLKNFTTGSELLAKLATGTKTIALAGGEASEIGVTMELAQKELARQGQLAMTRGKREAFLGLTSIFNNAGAREDDNLTKLNALRSMYFTGMIGKSTLLDPVHGGISRLMKGKEAMPFAEQLMQASSKTGPASIRAVTELGHFGFAATQVPFAMEMTRTLRHQIEEGAAIGKADPMETTITRMRAYERSEGRPIVNIPDSRKRSDDSKLAFLQSYEEELLGTATTESKPQIEAIMAGARGFAVQRNETDRPLSPQDKQKFESDKRKFILEQLAPLLFASGGDIAAAEHGRASQIGANSAEFGDKRMLTATEIHGRDQTDNLSKTSKETRSAAAVALLYLTATDTGAFKGVSTSGGELSSADTLLQREVTVPSWSITYHPPNAGQAPSRPVEITVPVPGTTREPVTQTLSVQDVISRLERDLADTQSVNRRILTGDVLTRAGMPGETYAATLERIISNPSTATNDRNRAIVNLGGVMLGLRDSENRSSGDLSAADRLAQRSMSNGYSSKDIRDYLHQVSMSAKANGDNRALARYAVGLMDRRQLDGGDYKKLEEISSGNPPSYKLDVFVSDTLALAFPAEAPHTVADVDRRFQAALALQDLAGKSGQLTGPDGRKYSSADANRVIAECATFPGVLSQNIEAKRDAVDGAKHGLDLLKDQPEALKTALVASMQREEASLATMQAQIPLASDIGLRSLDSLMSPINLNGIQKTRLAHMDSSDDPAQRAAAMAARTSFVDLLKTPCKTADDIRVREHIIKSLPSLLSAPRTGAGGANSTQSLQLAEMRAAVIPAIQALLISGLDDRSSMASAKREFPTQVAAVRDFGDLYQASQLRPELREAAIYALASMDANGTSKNLISQRLFVEREASPEVRLAAVRAYQKMAAPTEFSDTIQSILNRKAGTPSAPLETDAAVALAMGRTFTPVGLGLAPDERVYRQNVERVQAEIAQGSSNRANIESLIENAKDAAGNPKYKWLTAEGLRASVVKAKDGQYSWFGSYLWEDMHMAPGVPTNIGDQREAAAQQEAFKAYGARFAKLAETAFEGSGKDAAEARDILLWLATDTGRDWKRSADSDNALRAAGHSDENLFVSQDHFNELRTMAAKALAGCIMKPGADGKPQRIEDSNAREMQKLLQAGLNDPNAPALCKMYFMQGLQALCQNPKNTQERAERSTGDATAAVLTSLMQSLKQDRPMPAVPSAPLGQKSHERFWTQSLQLAQLQFLRDNSRDPQAISFIDAIATSDKGVPGADRVSPAVKQAAIDIVAWRRDRVLPLSQQSPSMVEPNTAERETMLDDANNAARRFMNGGKPTVAAGQVPVDIAKGLQTREDDQAVHLILAGAKGTPINGADPRAQQLLDLMDAAVSERVREAAAIAALTNSNAPELRAEAIGVVAREAVSGSRAGYRQDAQQVLDSVSSPTDVSEATRALTEMRGQLLREMSESAPTQTPRTGTTSRTQGSQTANIGIAQSDAEIVERLRAAQPDNPKLFQYASCLTNLARLTSVESLNEPGLGRDGESATAMYQHALNIYRHAPYTADLPRTQKGDLDAMKLEAELKQSVAGSEDLRAAVACLQKFGAETQSSHVGDAYVLMSVARGLQSTALGPTHRDTVDASILAAIALQKRAESSLHGFHEKKVQFADMERVIAEMRVQSSTSPKIGVMESRSGSLGTELLTAAPKAELELKLASDSVQRNHQRIVSAFGRNDPRVIASYQRYAEIQAELGSLQAEMKTPHRDSTKSRVDYAAASTASFKRAEQAFKNAITVQESAANANPESVAAARYKLYSFYSENQRHGEAKQQLDAIERIYAGKQSQNAAVVQREIASTAIKLADNAGADKAMERWRDMVAVLHGDSSIEFRDLLQQQATMYGSSKRFDQSEKLMTRSVELETQAAAAATAAAAPTNDGTDQDANASPSPTGGAGNKSTRLANALYKIADVYYAEGKNDESLKALRSGLVIERRSNAASDLASQMVAGIVNVSLRTGAFEDGIAAIEEHLATLGKANADEFSLSMIRNQYIQLLQEESKRRTIASDHAKLATAISRLSPE